MLSSTKFDPGYSLDDSEWSISVCIVQSTQQGTWFRYASLNHNVIVSAGHLDEKCQHEASWTEIGTFVDLSQSKSSTSEEVDEMFRERVYLAWEAALRCFTDLFDWKVTVRSRTIESHATLIPLRWMLTRFTCSSVARLGDYQNFREAVEEQNFGSCLLGVFSIWQLWENLV